MDRLPINSKEFAESLSPSKRGIDWILLASTLPIIVAGLLTMNSFIGQSPFFDKQLVVVGISLAAFFAFSYFDFRIFRRTSVLSSMYLLVVISLCALFFLASVTKGVQSWFHLGPFAFQPSDPAKLVLILVLAKYFSRRHIEIANIKHILVSGAYAFIFFVLILVQPDFGSAFVIFIIWLGMVLVSGLSKRHLFLVFLTGVVAFSGLWFTVLKDYQKARIKTFLNPTANISSTGYTAHQSTIAIGSGQLLGKGLGFGTQSRLKFLPEYQTDFIFAAYAEEWGFIGVLILFFFYGLLFWRIIVNANQGATNFEVLYGIGLATMIMAHFTINVGMNMGILPVTGLVAPFMSYGGSHLLTEFAGLGILMGMRRYSRPIHRDVMKNEFLGL